VLGFNLLAALMALYMLARHGGGAVRLLRAPSGRARALVPLLTCLVALAVLVMAARGLLLVSTRLPGGPP